MTRQILKTPAGVMYLIGVTYIVAAILAIVATTQRSWFERHIREKYSLTSEKIGGIGRQLAGFTNGIITIRNLVKVDRSALYEAWMQSSNQWPSSAPAAMVWADPDLYLTRVRLTLACGDLGQQSNALVFLQQSRHPEAIPVLEYACRKAKLRRINSLEAVAQRALERCRQDQIRIGALN